MLADERLPRSYRLHFLGRKRENFSNSLLHFYNPVQYCNIHQLSRAQAKSRLSKLSEISDPTALQSTSYKRGERKKVVSHTSRQKVAQPLLFLFSFNILPPSFSFPLLPKREEDRGESPSWHLTTNAKEEEGRENMGLFLSSASNQTRVIPHICIQRRKKRKQVAVRTGQKPVLSFSKHVSWDWMKKG